ncbi:hypothetical protein [Endozoicomonas sp. SCSIO W0465]|uniref:hypothetical protein n=1 Tax=Endozoicomonas sp. SCSIO W0465 TaxID=2918516 RepID=UPI0020754905|nr:hypothetical protein [Endozoicomonas sp. SCSIO W0465]USE35471.1 hypothetical protein MJO57_25795 [Endozoicomonas sp. SCSIO W0465]
MPDDPYENIQWLDILRHQAECTLQFQGQYKSGSIQDIPYLEFRSFPNRLYPFDESIQRAFEVKKGQSHPRKACALCNNDPRLLNTHFSGITIISNFRPYSSECWLIKPTDHLDQSKIFKKSSDLLDLAKGMGSAFTFAHSGYRGNSQKHLHIHAMRESLPLRKALDDGKLSCDADLPVIQQGKTTVRWMAGDRANNTAHFSGIHITGKNHAEFEHVFNKTLKYLSNSDVCEEGGYNLAYWVDDNNCLQAFIFPRNKHANVNPQYVPEKQGYGVLEMCGLLIMAPVNAQKVGAPAAKELILMRERPYEDFVARARAELTRLTPEQWQELANKF